MISKYINDPEDLIEEMIDGFVKANQKQVKKVTERVLARKEAPIENKVGVVSGGGSGHQPAFIGYLGEGLLDAVAVGNIFAAPGVEATRKAIEIADSGQGVICCIGNFSGDIMNFEMAAEMAEAEDIDVEIVIINDDVASAPKDKLENRRGVAGEVIIWKLVGAMAEEGFSLQEIKEMAEQAIYNTRSMGVAHSPCILPNTGKESFSLAADEMEIGVGHHGEPGIERVKMKSANEVTTLLTKKVIADLPFTEGDEVIVMINGLGATSHLEMDICYRKVYDILQTENIGIYRNYIGEFFTSQEMAGFSVTLTKLNEQLKKLIDAPCNGVLFSQR